MMEIGGIVMEIGGIDFDVQVELTDKLWGRLITTMRDAWPKAVYQVESGATFGACPATPPSHLYVSANQKAFDECEREGVTDAVAKELICMTFEEGAVHLVTGYEGSSSYELGRKLYQLLAVYGESEITEWERDAVRMVGFFLDPKERRARHIMSVSNFGRPVHATHPKACKWCLYAAALLIGRHMNVALPLLLRRMAHVLGWTPFRKLDPVHLVPLILFKWDMSSETEADDYLSRLRAA